MWPRRILNSPPHSEVHETIDISHDETIESESLDVVMAHHTPSIDYGARKSEQVSKPSVNISNNEKVEVEERIVNENISKDRIENVLSAMVIKFIDSYFVA